MSGALGAPLYERLLGAAWSTLPAPIRQAHAVRSAVVLAGRGTVERGRHPLAHLVARVVGFPRAAADVEVRVRFDESRGVETWTRTFGRRSFRSRQFEGRGRWQGLLCERFGPLVFGFALVVDGSRLVLRPVRWSVFGLPLPLSLGPTATAYETVEAGRFRFHVEIGHPLTGLIVRYRGWLEPSRGVGDAR